MFQFLVIKTLLQFPIRGCLPDLKDENMPFMFLLHLYPFLTRVCLRSPNMLHLFEAEDCKRELKIIAIAVTLFLCAMNYSDNKYESKMLEE